MSFKPSAKKRHVKTDGLGRSNLVKAYTVDVNRTKTKKMFNDEVHVLFIVYVLNMAKFKDHILDYKSKSKLSDVLVCHLK